MHNLRRAPLCRHRSWQAAVIAPVSQLQHLSASRCLPTAMTTPRFSGFASTAFPRSSSFGVVKQASSFSSMVEKGADLEAIYAELAEGDAGLNKILPQLLPLHTIAEAGISKEEALKRLKDCREKGAGLTHGAYDGDVEGNWVVHDVVVPSIAGGAPINVKLHTPLAGGTDLPVVIWMHGGGLTCMDYKDNYGAALFKSFAASMCWASVDYKLAPEAKFPDPVDDVVSVYEYFKCGEPVSKHGISTSKVHIAGVSAGAYLAGHAACRLASKGMVPTSLCMMYPMVRPTPLFATTDPATKTSSFNKYGQLGASPGGWIEWSWVQALGDPDGKVSEARLKESDLTSADWTSLKDVPTLLVLGKMDCLYDEGVLLAETLNNSSSMTFLEPAGSHTSAHMHDAEAGKRVTSWWEAKLL